MHIAIAEFFFDTVKYFQDKIRQIHHIWKKMNKYEICHEINGV